MKLYKLENKEEKLNTKDIDGIIAILNWANKAFSDGTEKAKERDCWIEKLKTIRETVS